MPACCRWVRLRRDDVRLRRRHRLQHAVSVRRLSAVHALQPTDHRHPPPHRRPITVRRAVTWPVRGRAETFAAVDRWPRLRWRRSANSFTVFSLHE